MSIHEKPNFLYHFDKLEDPRIDRKKLYPLSEILLLVLSGSICGAQSWRDLVTFGEEKLCYLRKFLPYDQGVPSKNTLVRVIASLDPEAARTIFALTRNQVPLIMICRLC